MEKTTRQQLVELALLLLMRLFLMLLLLVRLVLLPLFLLLLLLADDDFAACQQLLLREAQKTSKKLRMVRPTMYSLRRYPGQITNDFNIYAVILEMYVRYLLIKVQNVFLKHILNPF